MTPTRSTPVRLAATTFALVGSLLFAACSKPAPTSATNLPPTVAADPASSPLPGVIGQPSDVTADHTQTSPAAGATAVGGLTTHPGQGTSATGGSPAPTGGDASPGHAASSASP